MEILRGKVIAKAMCEVQLIDRGKTKRKRLQSSGVVVKSINRSIS